MRNTYFYCEVHKFEKTQNEMTKEGEDWQTPLPQPSPPASFLELATNNPDSNYPCTSTNYSVKPRFRYYWLATFTLTLDWIGIALFAAVIHIKFN